MAIKEIKFGNLVKDKTVENIKDSNKDTQIAVLKELGKGSDQAHKDADRMANSNAKLLEAMKKAGM